MDYSFILQLAGDIYRPMFGLGIIILIVGLTTGIKANQGQAPSAILLVMLTLGLMGAFPQLIEQAGDALYQFGQDTREELDQELATLLQGLSNEGGEQGSTSNTGLLATGENIARGIANLTPENLIKAIYWALAKLFIWAAQIIRNGYVYLQQFLILVGVTMSPLMLSMFAWQPLQSYAWNFSFTMFALILWPIAWLFADAFILLSLSPWLETLNAGTLLEASATAIGAFFASIGLFFGILTMQTFCISLLHYFMRGHASSAPGTGYRFGSVGGINAGSAGAKTSIAAAGAGTVGAAALGTAATFSGGQSAAASPGATTASAAPAAATSNTQSSAPAGQAGTGQTGEARQGSSQSTTASTASTAETASSQSASNAGSAWSTPWSSEGASAPSQSASTPGVSASAFSSAVGSRNRPIST